MSPKILLFLLLVALGVADDDHERSYGTPNQDSDEEKNYGPAKYEFSYAVKDDDSGNDFGHQEARDGDHTDGSHYVHLPDGRLQKVTYYVEGNSGFIADVSYEGEAHYPDSKEEGYDIASPPSPPKSLYEAP